MINPYVLDAGYRYWKNAATGRKYYLLDLYAGGQRVMGRRRTFKTAREAKSYSERVLARWRRQYDAWQALPEEVKMRVRPDLFRAELLKKMFPATLEERPDDAEPGTQISGLTLEGEILPPVVGKSRQ